MSESILIENDQLLQQAKSLAAVEHITLNALVEEALQNVINNKESEDSQKLELLKKEVDEGIQDLENGRHVSFNNFDEMESHLDEITNKILKKST